MIHGGRVWDIRMRRVGQARGEGWVHVDVHVFPHGQVDQSTKVGVGGVGRVRQGV